ncbi:unnamed protein product [Microthlaspi erraticum]|uniref:Uncharacterized protein n=1 Tax=Microthlaspi erraticum TaxID=1685480 RepID=A0A6D2KI59_9BRAS|nr:unnamed protein product [Microthlaspi erraticum]
MVSNILLPWELESEILVRVPATYLKHWRFLCKRWYALFKDPKFTKKNSSLVKAETRMVLKRDQSIYSFSFNISGIHNRYDQFIEFTGKLRNLKSLEDVRIHEISYCEGLVLCTTKDNRLIVWNPCTCQTSKWIIPTTRYTSMLSKNFLGYDNNNSESCVSYKILSKNTTVSKYEMYDFNSDTWRLLDVGTDHDKWCVQSSGVFFKGNTYWLDYDNEDFNFILRFDFTTERFERLSLPFVSDDYDDNLALSVVGEEKLAVLCQLLDCEFGEMKIWVTNAVTDGSKDLSWSVLVDFGKLVKNNMTNVTSFLVDEENKKVMCCAADMDDEQRITIHVVGEGICKQVYREVTQGSANDCPLLVGYVPSLVHIPASQTNHGVKRKR